MSSFTCVRCRKSYGGLFSFDGLQNYPFTCTNPACGIVVCFSCAGGYGGIVSGHKCPKCGRECAYPGQHRQEPPQHRQEPPQDTIPSNVFIVRFQNMFGRPINLALWSMTRDVSWPEEDVFYLKDERVHSFSLNIENAEYDDITWGAWTADGFTPEDEVTWNGGRPNYPIGNSRKYWSGPCGGKRSSIEVLK